FQAFPLFITIICLISCVVSSPSSAANYSIGGGQVVGVSNISHLQSERLHEKSKNSLGSREH
uniref:Uncharacterized protein n=1 Tax=Parascaris equorum TaxID=6256 RepID=A0A914RTY2_PAREQ